MGLSTFPVRVIGISGLAATGTSQLLKLLGGYLDWPIHSGGDSVRQIQKDRNCSHLSIPEFQARFPDLDLEIEEQNREFVCQNRRACVIECRLAVEAIKGVEGSRSILLICEDQKRFERVSKRDHVSLDVARGQVLARDADDRRRYRLKYGIQDFTDRDRYHHVIDTTGHQSPVECLEIALDLISRPLH